MRTCMHACRLEGEGGKIMKPATIRGDSVEPWSKCSLSILPCGSTDASYVARFPAFAIASPCMHDDNLYQLFLHSVV